MLAKFWICLKRTFTKNQNKIQSLNDDNTAINVKNSRKNLYRADSFSNKNDLPEKQIDFDMDMSKRNVQQVSELTEKSDRDKKSQVKIDLIQENSFSATKVPSNISPNRIESSYIKKINLANKLSKFEYENDKNLLSSQNNYTVQQNTEEDQQKNVEQLENYVLNQNSVEFNEIQVSSLKPVQNTKLEFGIGELTNLEKSWNLNKVELTENLNGNNIDRVLNEINRLQKKSSSDYYDKRNLLRSKISKLQQEQGENTDRLNSIRERIKKGRIVMIENCKRAVENKIQDQESDQKEAEMIGRQHKNINSYLEKNQKEDLKKIQKRLLKKNKLKNSNQPCKNFESEDTNREDTIKYKNISEDLKNQDFEMDERQSELDLIQKRIEKGMAKKIKLKLEKLKKDEIMLAENLKSESIMIKRLYENIQKRRLEEQGKNLDQNDNKSITLHEEDLEENEPVRNNYLAEIQKRIKKGKLKKREIY